MPKQKANNPEPDFVYQQLLEDELRHYAFNGSGIGLRESKNPSKRANETKLEALNAELSEISRKINALEAYQKKGEEEATESLGGIEERLNKSDKKVRLLQKRIRQEKARSIEMIAVFVALLTFISSEIQLFKIVDKPNEVAGFSLLIGGLLVFFVLAMEIVLWGSGLLRKDRLKFFTLLGVCLLFVLLGSAFLGVFEGVIASGTAELDK